MKKPLGYQNTEHDSLSTTVMNAFNYLLDKTEIPVEILNAANELTLNKNDIKITDFLIWLNDFTKSHELDIKFKELPSSDITANSMSMQTQNGNAFIAKCHGNHFVLITKIDEVNTYLFDPYYLDIDFPKEDEDYKIICDEQFKYNRIVHNERFFNSQEKSYSLANPKECILVETNKIMQNDLNSNSTLN